MIDIIMIAFGTLVIGFGLGFRFGWYTRENVAKKFVQAYINNVSEETKANTVNIDIKRDGDIFFIYNKDSGEFLAQGSNHTDISGILSARFPTKIFIATPENLEQVGYILNERI